MGPQIQAEPSNSPLNVKKVPGIYDYDEGRWRKYSFSGVEKGEERIMIAGASMSSGDEKVSPAVSISDGIFGRPPPSPRSAKKTPSDFA